CRFSRSFAMSPLSGRSRIERIRFRHQPSRLSDVLPSIDLDDLTGYVACLVRSKKRDEVCQVLRLPQPLEDDFRQCHFDNPVPHGGFPQHGGFNQARGDRVYVYVKRPQFPGHRFGIADYASLGGRIVRLTELSAKTVYRGNVYYLSIFLFLEQRGCIAGEIKAALQVDFNDPVPLLFGHFPGYAVPVHPGVVDQDVYTAECLDGLLYDLFGPGKYRGVALERDRPAAHLPDLPGIGLCLLPVPAVCQTHVRPFTGKFERGCGADTL